MWFVLDVETLIEPENKSDNGFMDLLRTKEAVRVVGAWNNCTWLKRVAALYQLLFPYKYSDLL